jgi:hypothetical protein
MLCQLTASETLIGTYRWTCDEGGMRHHSRPGDHIPEGEIFHTYPDWPWGLSSLLKNGYRVFLPGVKWPGRAINQPPMSSAELQEKVEIYIYSPSRLAWPVVGWTLPLTCDNIPEDLKSSKQRLFERVSALPYTSCCDHWTTHFTPRLCPRFSVR